MRVVPAAVVLLASVTLSVGLAAPAAADVGVFPVKVTGYPDNHSVASRVLANVRTVLGAAHTRELATKPGCEESLRCRAEEVKEPIEEVAFIVVERLSSDEARITLRVFDGRGERILEIESTIPHDEASTGAEALFRQAFDPAHYGGTLEVTGVPPGAELLVDGLRLEEPRARLRVGQHRLEVMLSDRVIEPIDFTIAFAKTRRIEIPAPVAPVIVDPPARPSSWSPIIAGSVAVAGAATAVTFALLRELAWRPQIDLWQNGIDNALAAGNDPTGRKFATGYGATDEQRAASTALVQTGLSATGRRGFEAQDAISVVGIVVGATVGVGGAGAAAATWYLGLE